MTVAVGIVGQYPRGSTGSPMLEEPNKLMHQTAKPLRTLLAADAGHWAEIQTVDDVKVQNLLGAALRPLILFIAIFFSLFTGAALGQSGDGDWVFRIDAEETSFERRVALTPAQPYSGGEPKAMLAIRRLKPEDPMELVYTATYDDEEKECDYSNWEVAIDKTNVPVLGFPVSSATAVLKPMWGTSDEDLWRPFRKGSKFAVRVEQKCDGFFGDKKLKIHTFSLRGSTAAYNFVLGKIN